MLYMGVLSAWAWPQIPAGARIPIHWNAGGSPNGYAEKLFGLLFVPLLGVAILLLLAVIPQLEPRRVNLWQSARAYNVLWTAFTAVLSVVHTSIVLNAVGRSVNTRFVAVAVAGVILTVLGNYLGKVRSNFFVGIRTLWTLSSELSWNKTHRLVGRLFVVLGLALLLTLWIDNSALSLGLMLTGIGLIAACSYVYSYVTWKQDPAKQTVGR